MTDSTAGAWRLARLCIGLGLLVQIVACAQIPVAEFNAYTEAFSQARTSSEQVLDDHAAAKAELAKIKAASATQTAAARPIPESFDPAAAIARPAGDADVQMRTKAWDTMSRYNDALVALAEGKSPQQVKNSFAALSESVTSLASTLGTTTLGALGPATPLIGEFLQLAEQARTRKEFIAAIRSGEPIILEIIDVFIADTRDYYDMRRTLAERDELAARREVIKLAGAMTRLAAEHKEPAAGVALVAKKADVAKKLSELLSAMDSKERTITVAGAKRPLGDLTGSSAANAPAYDELVHSQLEQFLESTSQALAARERIIGAVEQYRRTLTAYAQLLAALKAKMTIVRVKIDSPPDIRQSATEILTAATVLRAELASYREARSAN